MVVYENSLYLDDTADLRDSFLQKTNLNVNKDNLVISHLLIYKRKSVYRAIVYIVLFISCAENSHYLVYHEKYHHCQDEV